MPARDSIKGLLEHLLRAGAGELDISSECPPRMTVRNESVAVGPDSITNDNVADLLYHLATVDQVRGLNTCGDVHFIFLFRNWARFSVPASMTHRAFSIQI